ncbi:MAG: penicillin-binding protein 1C [Ectothiorhodospiraceae bacterium]|nr:penicillin-binding protein 1C [Ectothiorhodospiraceae bacterium]
MTIFQRVFSRSIKPGLVLLFFAISALAITAFSRATLEAPFPTLLINDRHGKFLAEISQNEDRGYGFWPLKQLPPRVIAATLAIEDRRFWMHPGVDPLAVGRALWQNLNSSQRVSGASTIAMQLARMQAPAARNYFNKLIETATALALTLRYGREQVLSHYLRLVPYGNNIHGIAYAARRYLNKPVDDMSWAEIAFLSAIPQSPGRMNLYTYKGRGRAITRGKRILAQLRKQAVISEAEYPLALRQIENIQVPRRQQRPNDALHAILKMEHSLKQSLKQSPQNTSQQTTQTVFTSSLDLNIQDRLTTISRTLLAQWRKNGAGNAALIVIDRTDNSVLSWIGSSDYFDPAHSGAIDYTRVKRSSGSTLKPFIYALGLDRGDINATTLLADIPASGLALRNSDMRHLGPLLPRQALANSRNVPLAQVVERIGLNTAYTFLGNLNLHQSTLPAQHYGLGIALGGLPVTLEELVTAYASLANDGVLKELRWFKNQPTSKGKRILSESTARQITLFLSDPTARLPSFPRMGSTEYPFPVAVKTGTSQAYRDAWTIAYSQRYLVGVWVGDPDNQPMYKLSGAGSAAVLVQKVMLSLHDKQRHGQDDLSFPTPEGYVKVALCANSGKRASKQCNRHFEEWLKPEHIPNQQDQGIRRIMVDKRSGEKATEKTPQEFRQLHTVLDLPPRYAVWASQQAGLNATNFNNERITKNGSHNKITPYKLNQQVDMQQNRQPIELEILSPKDGVHFISNPEIPSTSSSIELSVQVSPAVKQITWYVNGKPYKNADYPYNVRLPLTSGKHIIQAAIPLTDERSKKVVIFVE